jgi:hypothetical protein
VQESQGVKEALQRFYDAFTANDVKAFEEGVLTSQQEILAIGTAPHEWHTGRDKMLEEFGMEGVRLRGGDMTAWEEGSVGWFADRPTFTLPDGTEVECRLTGVMRNEDAGWRLVQAHFSIGIPDEEAAGQDWTA